MNILGGLFVYKTPEGLIPKGIYSEVLAPIHGLSIVVENDDPYWTVHFIQGGTSLIHENMIINLELYMTEVAKLTKEELWEKVGAV